MTEPNDSVYAIREDVEARTIDAVLDAIPDGWAKLDGEWIRLRPQQDYGDPNGGMGPLWTTEEP